MLAKGRIELDLTNILPDEIIKLRNIFTQLTEYQIHRFRNGKIILHFDHDGELRRIDTEKTLWKK